MAAWRLTTRDLAAPNEMERWGKAVGRCPWRNPLAETLWLDVWPRQWGILRPIGLFSGEELVGGVILAQRRRWGQTVLETHPMVPYAGWWLADPPDASPSKIESFHEAALEALDDHLRGHCAKAVLRFDPRFTDARPLIRRGWSIWNHYTYISYLKALPEQRSREALFENDVRRQIDSARKEGITVSRDNDWAAFEHLARQTHERKDLIQHYPPGYLAALGQALEKTGAGALFMARSAGGEALAGAAIAWDAQRAIYLYGGSSEAARGTGAPSLLHAQILAEMAAAGLDAYDWHGANTPGVIAFKKNFNPSATPYLVARKCYGASGEMAHSVKDAFGRWIRRG